jgi:hypothetical protein
VVLHGVLVRVQYWAQKFLELHEKNRQTVGFFVFFGEIGDGRV